MYQEMAKKKWKENLIQFDVFDIKGEHQVFRRPLLDKYDLEKITAFMSCKQREYGCLFLHRDWKEAVDEFNLFIVLTNHEAKTGRCVKIYDRLNNWYFSRKDSEINKIKCDLASKKIQKWWKNRKSKNRRD